MACGDAERPDLAPSATVAPASLESAVASARTPSPAASIDLAPPAVPFIEDDLGRATALAAAEKKLLFVDAWAPWCDACLSVRAEVLTRAELEPFAARFVFASIDVDRAPSETFLARHGARALPTLAVLDPSTGELIAMRTGAVSLGELVAMLEDATSTVTAARADLARAHALASKGERRAAAALFERIAAGAVGAARTEAALAALDAWHALGEDARCAWLAERESPRIKGGAGPSTLLGYWVRCAAGLTDADARSASLAAARAATQALVDAPPPDASTLERAATLGLAAELARTQGDAIASKQRESERVALLERGEREADTASEKESFDHALVGAYVAAGRPEDAVALLRARVDQRPDRYETHGRLGTTLLSVGRAREAIAPLERAIALAYGPPRCVYLGRLSRAYADTSQPALARRTLELEIEGWRGLPPAQRDAARLAEALRRLDEAAPRTP